VDDNVELLLKPDLDAVGNVEFAGELGLQALSQEGIDLFNLLIAKHALIFLIPHVVVAGGAKVELPLGPVVLVAAPPPPSLTSLDNLPSVVLIVDSYIVIELELIADLVGTIVVTGVARV